MVIADADPLLVTIGGEKTFWASLRWLLRLEEEEEELTAKV